MPTFILSLNWTEQGIRSVKDSPKRAQAARDLGKKLGVEIKQVFLTSGESDLLLIVDAADGDNIAKFALALGSQSSIARFGKRSNWGDGAAAFARSLHRKVSRRTRRLDYRETISGRQKTNRLNRRAIGPLSSWH